MNIHVDLTNNEIDVNDIVNKCKDPRGGALNVFLGLTRNFYEDESGKKDVVTLSYEADEELSLMEMNDICQEAIEKFGCLKIIIVHRLGEVGVEGISIAVGVITEHRDKSFEATQWVMRVFKARVPIFKKEIYGDNSSVWKVNKENFEDNTIPEKINFS